ncbi:C40 family peptidase, partial [Candidatus Sumerlaeota bacterium]|nr:C40 family peptidase [Candidatus Sumerlaeota bacterium]
YKELNVYDSKTTWFNVKAEKESEKIILKGEVMFPQHKNGLEMLFKYLGYDQIDNTIKVLPEDAGLGTLEYGLVTTYTTPLRGDYTEPRSILDEALYGSYVRLLKPAEDTSYYLVQVPNGYIGWMKTTTFKPISHQQWQKWMAMFPKAMVLNDTKIRVTDGENEINVPKGCILPITRKQTDKVSVLLPEGRRAEISAKVITIISPNRGAGKYKILNIASELMGLKYKWGGFSPRGYDCSGFSRMVYLMRGIYLPRDADEQSAVGEIVAFRNHVEDLLPGDLLFFVSRFGRIGHVAVSLGGKEFIHSSHPDIHINSLEPESPEFSEDYLKKFAFARRILIGGF